MSRRTNRRIYNPRLNDNYSKKQNEQEDKKNELENQDLQKEEIDSNLNETISDNEEQVNDTDEQQPDEKEDTTLDLHEIEEETTENVTENQEKYIEENIQTEEETKEESTQETDITEPVETNKDEQVQKVIERENQLERIKENESLKNERVFTKPYKKVQKGESLNREEKNTSKPHYVFARDPQTGKATVISVNVEKKEETVMPIKQEKIDMAKGMLIETERSIMKLEIEIVVNEKLRNLELNPKRIEALDRKITTLRESLEEQKKRKDILNHLISQWSQ